MKSLAIFEKASLSLKSLTLIQKASVSLKMSSKSLVVFIKASNHFISVKISLKCRASFKIKPRILKKKSLATIAALPQWPVRPNNWLKKIGQRKLSQRMWEDIFN
jgi:hypothetical protein